MKIVISEFSDGDREVTEYHFKVFMPKGGGITASLDRYLEYERPVGRGRKKLVGIWHRMDVRGNTMEEPGNDGSHLRAEICEKISKRMWIE